jgi:hypothetical protein
MSWDVDEKEFYETFAEITEDRGLEDAKKWAWAALNRPQMELRESEKKIEELLKHRESCVDNLLKGYETGKSEERAAVVKWLRQEAEAAAQTYTVQAGEWANRIDALADNIECGEHRREERKS